VFCSVLFFSRPRSEDVLFLLYVCIVHSVVREDVPRPFHLAVCSRVYGRRWALLEGNGSLDDAKEDCAAVNLTLVKATRVGLKIDVALTPV